MAGAIYESHPFIPPHKRVFVPPHKRVNSKVAVKTATERISPPSTGPPSPAPSLHVHQPSTKPPSPTSYKVVNNWGESEHAPVMAAPRSFPQEPQEKTAMKAPHVPQQRSQPFKAQPTLVVPPRNRNDKWVKDSDLRNGRWAAEQNKSNKAPSLEWGYGAGWDDVFNPNDAKDATYSLINYDGSWAPAPDDWDSRPAFRDHQSVEGINKWLLKIEDETLRFTKDPSSTNFHQVIPSQTTPGETDLYYFTCPPNIRSAKIMGDLAPMCWRPDPMEGHISLGDFWGEHQKSAPQPCDSDDLQDVKPWWDYSPSPMACFQLPLKHPEIRGIDPLGESKDEQRKRSADKGSNGEIERWKAGFRPGRGRGRGRGRGGRDFGGREREPTPSKLVEEPIPWISSQQDSLATECIPDTSIHPKVNLYLRKAQTSDMAQITKIYNHYATDSLRVPECTSVAPRHMLDRFNSITTVFHVFIVACLASGPKGATKGPGKRNKHNVTNDRIIGFAYSDDFNDPLGMYRFLAEVEVYTDPEFARMGVASCLMDKLVSILDPYWTPRGGYEIRDDSLGRESTRQVNCLWINLPYVPEDDEKEWAGKWLGAQGFEQTGDHKKVGYKIGKWYVVMSYGFGRRSFADVLRTQR